MIDATILIPTHRHAELLPYGIRSALAQEGCSVELFIVGDGVEDDTRAAIEPFRADPRVRFFDFPKGERHGESHRHLALGEAAGRIVCYVSDDDLVLPGHVSTMLELLAEVDFAHSPPFFVHPGDELVYVPFDLAQASQRARLTSDDWNAIGLTGAAHTLDSYRRLPRGWHPAPAGIWTDLYMWQQFLDLPGFRGVTGTELTHLHFPSPVWDGRPFEERVSTLAAWSAAIGDPVARRELARRAHRTSAEVAAADSLRAAELDHHVATLGVTLSERNEDVTALEGRLAEDAQRIADLGAALAAVESSRTWRLRARLLALRPLRAIAARLPATR